MIAIVVEGPRARLLPFVFHCGFRQVVLQVEDLVIEDAADLCICDK